MTRRLLRGGALLIALLAVVDPALPRSRASRPLVTLAVAPGVSSALVDRVRAALDGADVVDGVGGGDATVVVGAPPASMLAGIGGPAIVILPDTSAPAVLIDGLESPRSVALGASAGVRVHVRARGRPGDSLVVRLREGAVVVAREAVAATGGPLHVPLAYVPSAPGLAGVRVEASLVGADGSPRADAEGATDRRDIGVMVSPERRRVLVHEAVPSWGATFVRRALEADPRLQVESRTATSRGVSTGAGAAPANLADPAALGRFDVVVAGDAAALTGSEVAALERYVRDGGSALLLLDRPAAGAAGRLIGTGWTVRQTGRPVPLVPAGTADTTALLRASSVVVPVGGRPGLVPILVTPDDRATQRSPVVWRTALGSGTMLVSGATDSWRYRDSAQSRFSALWPNAVTEMAQWSRETYGLGMDNQVVAPGDHVRAAARFRGQSEAGGVVETALSGWFEPADSGPAGPPRRTVVRVWPGASPLEATLRFAAPSRPGRYRLVVARSTGAVDSARADAEFLVVGDAAPGEAFGGSIYGGLLARLVSSRGGRTLGEGELRSLPGVLTGIVRPPVRRVPWHPMRSAWWIVPFGLLLAAEWYLRRRAALP